jgi:general secretion pathway protein B
VPRAPAPDRTVAAVTAPPSVTAPASVPRPVETAAAPARSRDTTVLTPSAAAQPERVTPPRASTPPPAIAAAPVPAAPAPAAAPAGDFRSLAAKLSLQVLGWAPEPKDRFVFVNGRKYFEGQAIDDRFLIERIAEDSVVLSHQGERVTIKGP